MALTGSSSTGSVHTWVATYRYEYSASIHRQSHQLRCWWSVECHKDRSLDLSFSYCTLIKGHQLHPHAYTDDSHIYGFCQPLETVSLQDLISAWIDDVSLCMRTNRLQLNPSKTEVLWSLSPLRQHQIPSRPLCIGRIAIPPVSSVHDLGVHVASDLTMKSHVIATVRLCFAVLCQIRSVRRSLMPQALLTFFRMLVISKVDYCNSVLAGVSAHLLDRLQSVLNAAAWLIFSARKSECISPYSTTRHSTVIPCRQSTPTLYCWCWRSPLFPIRYR